MESFYKFVNLLLKMLFFGSICFYTTWAIIILLLYVLGFLKNFQSSILLILLTIFYVGNILTYIFPRVIVIPYIKRKISGRMLKIFNLVFHVLPLVLFLILYDTSIKSDNLYFAVLSLLAYLIFFNPFRVYNYSCKECKEEKIATGLILVYIIIVALMIIKQKNLF
jgi:hypothetical protein